MSTPERPSGLAKQQSRAKADELRKARSYEQAAAEYANVWPDGDKWTGWGYALSLRKAGRPKEALAVARDVLKIDLEFRPARSVYAWVLYDLYIRGATSADEGVLKAANAIVKFTAAEQQYEATSAFVITVLHIAKLWAKNGRNARALEWLGKLDVNRLRIEPGKGVDDKGRQKEIASNKEQYYSLLTHALERLERWEECIEACSRGNSECGTLHHDNDIWFSRRVAIAKQKLGQPKEALTALQVLAERKQAGFIHTDIAFAAWDAGEHELTFKHSLQALLGPQDIGFKLGAVRLLGQVLWERGDHEGAKKHLRLCIGVRHAKGWNASDELTTLAKTWGLADEQTDTEPLFRELLKQWRRWADELTPKVAGSVTKVLANGHAGFIRGDDGVDYYFDSRGWKSRNPPTERSRVSFATAPGFDRKKHRSTTIAVEVRPIVHT
ncbi:MAG: tetratricopeptide repeat protein [Terriglobales bacterium]